MKAVEELLFTAPTMKPTRVQPIYRDAVLGVLRAAIPYIIEDKGKKATHRSKSDRVTGIYKILEETIKTPYKIMPDKASKLSKNLVRGHFIYFLRLCVANLVVILTVQFVAIF